jgi:hypothetical protein
MFAISPLRPPIDPSMTDTDHKRPQDSQDDRHPRHQCLAMTEAVHMSMKMSRWTPWCCRCPRVRSTSPLRRGSTLIQSTVYFESDMD